MKAKKGLRFYIVTIWVAISVVMFCCITYFDFLKDSTFTTVTVVKDINESALLGKRWATVVDQNGDSLEIPVSEKLIFSKKVPFKATMKKSPRWSEQEGIIEVYIWNKEFWIKSFKVTIVEINYFSLHNKEVEVTAFTNNNINLQCLVDRDMFLNKEIPFSADAKFSRWKKNGGISHNYFIK